MEGERQSPVKGGRLGLFSESAPGGRQVFVWRQLGGCPGEAAFVPHGVGHLTEVSVVSELRLSNMRGQH